MLENTDGLGRSTNVYLFIIFVWPPISQKCDSGGIQHKDKNKDRSKP